jgi:hypothetical protein
MGLGRQFPNSSSSVQIAGFAAMVGHYTIRDINLVLVAVEDLRLKTVTAGFLKVIHPLLLINIFSSQPKISFIPSRKTGKAM